MCNKVGIKSVKGSTTRRRLAVPIVHHYPESSEHVEAASVAHQVSVSLTVGR